jgi:hypothetical protein
MAVRQEGPYGRDGDEAGENALGLLDNLLATKTPMPFTSGETPHWDDTDQCGFRYLYALQNDMDSVDMSWDASGLGTGELTDPWHSLTTALPFSEAERYWMYDAERAHSLQSKNREVPLSDSIVSVEATVMSAGIRQVLRGRDLVRRWAAWRRETHEFAGQGSLTTALFLLDHMAYELVPGLFASAEFHEQYPNVAEFDARSRL